MRSIPSTFTSTSTLRVARSSTDLRSTTRSGIISRLPLRSSMAWQHRLQATSSRVQMCGNAQMMIHDAKAFAGGNAKAMRAAADLLDRISNEIADIYATRANNDNKAGDFRDLMRAGDTWYNGNEALDMGLVDEVTDNPDEDAPEEATKNVWKAADIEAFLKMSPNKLAASASHLTTTNRVEEAHMTDMPVLPAQPQAAAPAAPVVPASTQVPPVAVTLPTFTMNGVEVTDFAGVQSHINP